MFRVANNMNGLLQQSRFFFSKDLFLSGSNPIRERVMSTPSWPVPYYQRLTKAYPIRGAFPVTQKRASPTSEASTCPPTTPPGSPPNAPSTRLPRADKSYHTPNSTSKPRVPPPPSRLPHQEGRLRDHGQSIRQRPLPVPRCHQQGKH